ncbi:MAG: hypothetical protein ACFFD3_13300, partial [Candidatus Thorarchaeota archaeon]
GDPIPDANITALFEGTTYSFAYIGAGLYSTSVMPVNITGLYTVTVTISETGFELTSLQLNLTILATTQIIANINPSVYETEELVLTIDFVDSVYDTPIDWASVNLTLQGVVYVAEFTGGHFVVRINMTFSPNLYPATIRASASGCRSAQVGISIEVLEKRYVYLTISDIIGATEGSQISIETTLRDTATDNIIPFVTIRFQVWVYFENDTLLYFEGTDSTNEVGVALWPFTIPRGLDSAVDRLEIRVSYNAPLDTWDAEAFSIVPVGQDLISSLISFFVYGVGFYIIVAFVFVGIIAGAYNKTVKPKKKASRIALDQQLRIFNDLDSMQHFMAVYLNRGTCVFYHPFKELRIQADLISGFIAAVTSVYGEIKGDGVQGTLEEIHYQGLRLNSYSGRYVLGILILEKEISPILRDRLQFFVEMFENEYDTHLQQWTGVMDCFDPEWIVSNLITAFSYDWVIHNTIEETAKMNRTERKIFNYIKASLNGKREFLIKDYLDPVAKMLGTSKAETLDSFLKMQEKGIIHPISVATILLRQGLGLPGVDELSEEEVQIPQEELVYEEIEEEEQIEVTEEPPAVDEQETSEEELEPPPDIEKEAPIEEQKKEKEKPKKKEIDPKDAFVAEVESLLKKEKEDESD